MIENKKETKLIFIKPTYHYNFIEKRIRKNVKYAKLFANSEKLNALTYETLEIPNSMYLATVKSNETILDILLKKKGDFFTSNELEKRVKEDKKILEIYLRNNINPINIDSTNEFILTKINNTTLLEYVLKNMKYNQNIVSLKSIETNEQIYNIIFNYLMEKDNLEMNQKDIVREIIKNSTQENRLQLYKKHFKNIKEYMDDSLFKYIFIDMIDSETIKFLLDIKEYNILKEINNTGKLESKKQEKNTLLRILLEKNINIINDFSYRKEDLLKALIDNKMYEKIEEILNDKYEYLLRKYDEENTILDLLIKSKNSELTSTNIWNNIKKNALTNIRVTKIFLKHQQWIEILNASDSILNSKYDETTTIFEYLISNIKENIENGKTIIISIYPISKKILLYKYNGKTILEKLLENKFTELLVLKNIDKNNLYSDIEIQTILKLNGINIKKEFGEVKFDIEKTLEKQKNEIIKTKYMIHSNEKISVEQQELIDELKRVFQEDGRSDQEIIELACNSFKSLFLNNYEYAERDLKSLINIKINNPEFIIIKDNCSHFDDIGLMGIDKIYDIDTFNHELTHVIHWYSSQYRIPESFHRQIIEINEEKLNEFFTTFVSQRIKIENKIKENYDFYNKNQNAKEDTQELKKRMERIIDEAEKNNSYSKEIIDYLKNNNTIQEEYKLYYNEVALRELTPLYQDNYLYSIIDIIDGLKRGEVYDKGIKKDDYMIKIGHGSKYYKNNEKHIFLEMIAQYNEIIKSRHKEKALKMLADIVGSELIDLLEEFNKELVVETLENKKQR
jgi:hypothetical protein